MKKLILLLTIFLGLAFAFSFTNKHTLANALTSKNKEIVMTGQAEIKTQPDRAKITFGLEVLKETLKESEQELWQQVKEIEKDIKELFLSSEHLQADSFYANKKYMYENGKETFMGYLSKANFSIIISDFDNIQPLTSAILKNATSFNSIQFYKEDTEQLYIQALNQALENAKQKAQTVSENKNLYLISLTEEISYYNSFSSENLTFSSESVGDLIIKAKVKASFGFEEKEIKDTANLYNENKLQESFEENHTKENKQTNQTEKQEKILSNTIFKPVSV